MCACSWDFVCSRCAGTSQDWRYWQGDDPRELEQERYAALISSPDFQKPTVEVR